MKYATRMVFIFLVTLIGSGTATAGLFRAYLSLNGNDANPCTVVQPCRLLPAAMAAVNTGGEIWMTDSANFNTGPVVITKSVKILAITGALGSLVANGGDAVIINAPLGDVTLRNLAILNLSGGVNGITIQAADAVHVEKLSIDGFNTDASSCINVNAVTQFRVFVSDSNLQECRNGIYANEPVLLNGTSQLYVDNTRIEHAINTGGVNATGMWIQGEIIVSLRNSVITAGGAVVFNAIQFDANIGGELNIINSDLYRAGTGVLVTNTTSHGGPLVSIVRSQIQHTTDSMIVTSSTTGGTVSLKIIDSHVADSDNGIQLSNSGDATSTFDVDLARSEIIGIGTTALDLAATNGGHLVLGMRDSTLSTSQTLINTSGTASDIRVSLIRSNFRQSHIAMNHGQGLIELDGVHVNRNANDFVNSGSGNIVSLGNNFVNDNVDGSAFTYITPTIIAPK
jgi:hypothetical protein